MGNNIKVRHAVSGLVGIVCPFPVIGESALAYCLYPATRELFKDSNAVLSTTVSLAVASLIRINFYKDYYFPAMEHTLNYIR